MQATLCQRLTDLQLRGQQLEDVIDLVLEPSAQHLIGLVQDKHLDAVCTQSPPPAAMGAPVAGRTSYQEVHLLPSTSSLQLLLTSSQTSAAGILDGPVPFTLLLAGLLAAAGWPSQGLWGTSAVPARCKATESSAAANDCR